MIRKIPIRSLLISMLLVGSVVALGVSGMVSAGEISNDSITLDDPDNEVVQVDLSYSGSATANVSLVKDGTTLVDKQVSGTSGSTSNVSLDATGLNEQDANLVVDVADADEGNVSVDGTQMQVSYTDTLTLDNATDANATTDVLADVSFNSSVDASATVEYTDADSGSTLGTDTVTFDAVESEGGTGLNTSTVTLDQSTTDTTNVSATVTVDPAQSYESIHVEKDTSAFGALGSAAGGDTRLIVMIALLIVGIGYARSEGWI